jgi:hypothetical protein
MIFSRLTRSVSERAKVSVGISNDFSIASTNIRMRKKQREKERERQKKTKREKNMKIAII